MPSKFQDFEEDFSSDEEGGEIIFDDDDTFTYRSDYESVDYDAEFSEKFENFKRSIRCPLPKLKVNVYMDNSKIFDTKTGLVRKVEDPTEESLKIYNEHFAAVKKIQDGIDMLKKKSESILQDIKKEEDKKATYSSKWTSKVNTNVNMVKKLTEEYDTIQKKMKDDKKKIEELEVKNKFWINLVNDLRNLKQAHKECMQRVLGNEGVRKMFGIYEEDFQNGLYDEYLQ
jgi:DNA repair exonuclease SbcCD ATPase subunit